MKRWKQLQELKKASASLYQVRTASRVLLDARRRKRRSAVEPTKFGRRVAASPVTSWTIGSKPSASYKDSNYQPRERMDPSSGGRTLKCVLFGY